MAEDAKATALDPAAKWERLRIWIREKTAELQSDGQEHLPAGFGSQATDAALLALESVLATMDFMDAGQA